MTDPRIIKVAHALAEALTTGLSITQIIAEVHKTGVVPDAAWQQLESDFDDAATFWNGVLAERNLTQDG